MKFYHEQIEERIEDSLRAIKCHYEILRDKKEQLRTFQNSKEQIKTNTLWKIGELLEEIPFVSYVAWTYDGDITATLRDITPMQFDTLFADIDDIMATDNWRMNFNYKQPTYITGQMYQYIKVVTYLVDGESYTSVIEALIKLSSSQCKRKPTGKMVQETKEDCSFIVAD